MVERQRAAALRSGGAILCLSSDVPGAGVRSLGTGAVSCAESNSWTSHGPVSSARQRLAGRHGMMGWAEPVGMRDVGNLVRAAGERLAHGVAFTLLDASGETLPLAQIPSGKSRTRDFPWSW